MWQSLINFNTTLSYEITILFLSIFPKDSLKQDHNKAYVELLIRIWKSPEYPLMGEWLNYFTCSCKGILLVLLNEELLVHIAKINKSSNYMMGEIKMQMNKNCMF